MSHLYEPVTSSESQNDGAVGNQVKRPLGKGELFRLAISMGGLQVTWVTVMAAGSPFLLSLGLVPSLVSLVWLSGPVCGTLLQPFIGYKSDTLVSINMLAWTSETMRLTCSVLGVNPYNRAPSLITKLLAVFWIWVLNISLQPVQAGLRALAVDCCPDTQQAEVGTFTSCIVLLGNLVGYGAGFLKMPIPSVPGLVENIQFKGLCLIASLCLGSTVAITCYFTKERSLATTPSPQKKIRAWRVFWEIQKTAIDLPPTVKTVCLVQFFSWLAWFPFLFYGVTYLSKIYKSNLLLIKMGPPSNHFYNALHEESIRHGTLALVLFSCVALITNFTLPYLIHDNPGDRTRDVTDIGNVWGRIKRNLTLPRAWMVSHVLSSISLFGLTVGEDFISSVVFVAILGISWGLTQWAPFAIIGAEIAKESIPNPLYRDHSTRVPEAASSSGSFTTNDEIDAEKQQFSSNHSPGPARSMAATTMGVHNIAISLPQICSAIISSLIFAISTSLNLGPTVTLAWVLRCGVVAAACAAYLGRGI
ncbi:MFS general substrate transporter [Penicillium nucicola]|uniref:MFS general substrate transporter n=1 Tax=Penicillium nucicola TaxID=1850975 RepID=UPI002545BCF0|nr:MFS general substrate transporter [Penicillium nucicola]KAJ5770663.1 MFS general substrate transporter [Penicillium nucicola]